MLRKIEHSFKGYSLESGLLILLVASWPFANFVATNAGKLFKIQQIVWMYGVCVLVLTVATLVTRMILKRDDMPILWVSFGYMFFFSYDALGTAFVKYVGPSTIDFLHSVHIKFACLFCSLFLLSLYIVYLFLKNTPFRRFFLFFTTAWAIGDALLALREGSETSLQTVQQKNLLFQEKPNVYFLLIDGYPRADTIERILRIKPDLHTSLRNIGFFVAQQSTSNYHFTLASLGTEMMMAYHMDVPSYPRTGCFSRAVTGYNPLVKIFKDNGYHFVFAPSGVLSEITCFGAEDQSIEKSKIDFELLRIFQHMTPLAPIPLGQRYLEPVDLEKFINSNKLSPVFLFAHFLQVHDSVVTHNGYSESAVQPGVLCDASSCHTYEKALTHFTKKIKNFVRYIQKKDPRALIVVQSDHGPCASFDQTLTKEQRIARWTQWGTSHTDQEILERFRNLIAVYIPALQKNESYTDYFYDTITPMNLWGQILSYLSNRSLPLKLDRNFLLSFNEKKRQYFLEKEVTTLIQMNP